MLKENDSKVGPAGMMTLRNAAHRMAPITGQTSRRRIIRINRHTYHAFQVANVLNETEGLVFLLF